MSDNDRTIELLKRIEQNQREVLEAQKQQLQIAQAQLERSHQTIQESIELQRTAVARQGQITKIVIPLLVVLLILLGYLLIKYRVL